MKADGVFQGGGVKGIAFVGAVCRFEEEGIEWQRLAGTSAGSIVAALLAVGYTGEELKSILLSLDYKRFMDKTTVQALPIVGKAMGLINENSFYSGNYIEEWMQELLARKNKTKFKDVMENGECRLKMIASDITSKNIVIIPDDLKRYGIDPMEFSIAKAVRMSASIPIYFKPVKLIHNDEMNFIVDGGVFSNFPIWIFDVEGKPRWPTFGFKFLKNTTSKNKCDNFIDYMDDLIESFMDTCDETYIKDKDIVRTMNIPTTGIKATDFNISKEKCLKLFELGYKSADEFIKNWDFKIYVKMHR